ncbi:hypothetical protein SAMN04487898_10647 [Pedobacter sp. ok626]|uniref:immunoglobulin domain-containing protein n=1 Tax=Pedobacter sp. ok626 TaxID=1761882 RepID=UPI00088C72B1|nr:hypothetical protein [Pedobacter sp. ok626]SDK10197.1 hypothetical protein SAMN04487898_10647 [Pedobacter sp. ok626]
MVIGMGQVKGQYTKIRAAYIGPPPANTGGTNGAAGTAGTLGAAGNPGFYSILNPAYLNDTDYTNSASVKATSGTSGSGVLGGAGQPSTAYLILNFSGTITPKTGNQIFLKINASNSAAILGTDAKTQVTVQGFNGGIAAGAASALSTLATTDGYFIFPVTNDFTSIKILVTTEATGLLSGNPATAQADVFDVYMFDPTCGAPTYTTTAVTGISLGGDVITPNAAIDGDLDTKSTLSVGLLGVLSVIKQTVYFSKVSNPGDAATITFSVPKAPLLDLGLFNGITLQAYNGAATVGAPMQVSSLLSLGLLGLLGDNTRYTASYIPSTTVGFDRLELSTGAVAQLLQNFYLHEVQQTPAKPTFNTIALQNPTICSGSPITLTPVAPASGNELRWYSSLTATSALTTANTYTPSPNLTATTTYYVATAKTGCSAESERVPVIVTVNTITPGTIATNQTICHGDTPAAFSASVGVGAGTISYQWQKSTDNITFNNITNATIATYAETTALNQTTYYRRIDTSTLNTLACSANTNVLTITINPKPPSPHIVIITNSQY